MTVTLERPDDEVRTRGDVGLSLWVVVVVLALVGGVAPLLLAHHFGAFGIPRNDDWAYAISAFRFAEHGTINGRGWASMNLVGQLVMALPVVWLVGHRIGALQVEVAMLGVVGLVAVFDLAKHVLPPRRALFVAVMVAVGPMWASLAASYMTDLPAFALAMVCLALGARAIRTDDVNVGVFWGAVLVGFWAFTVREYAIVAPLAVCLTALWATARWSRPRKALIVTALVSLAATAAVFVVWHRGLPGFAVLTPALPSPSSATKAFDTAAQSAVLVGLLVSPAVLLAGPKRIVDAARARAPRTTVLAGVLTALTLVVEVAQQQATAKFLGPGNYVSQYGTGEISTAYGTRHLLLPRSLLALLALVGVLTATLLVLAALPPTLTTLARLRERRLGSPVSPPLAIVTIATLGYGLTCVLPAAFGLGFYDRYLLPLVPLVGVLALRAGVPVAQARPSSRIVAGAALVTLAALGLTYAANAASFDGTKWQVAEQAANMAGGPLRIDGGLEWTDYHAGKDLFWNTRARPKPFCIVVLTQSTRPATGDNLLVTSVWGPTGTQTWIVARQRHPC